MTAPVVSYAARTLYIERTLELPFPAACVPAGFPSPAEDYLENSLDIAEYLVKRPKATYLESEKKRGAMRHVLSAKRREEEKMCLSLGEGSYLT